MDKNKTKLRFFSKFSIILPYNKYYVNNKSIVYNLGFEVGIMYFFKVISLMLQFLESLISEGRSEI